jgi:hypothetical protein
MERLRRKLAGYWQYYGVTGNGRSLCKFWRLVVAGLYKWLNRTAFSFRGRDGHRTGS